MIAERPPDPGKDEGRVTAALESNQSADNRKSIRRHASRRYSPAHVRFVRLAARLGVLSPDTAGRSLAREADMLLDDAMNRSRRARVCDGRTS